MALSSVGVRGFKVKCSIFYNYGASESRKNHQSLQFSPGFRLFYRKKSLDAPGALPYNNACLKADPVKGPLFSCPRLQVKQLFHKFCTDGELASGRPHGNPVCFSGLFWTGWVLPILFYFLVLRRKNRDA